MLPFSAHTYTSVTLCNTPQLQYLMHYLKPATQFRHALNVCIKEHHMYFDIGHFLQNYVPLNYIHILTISRCSTVHVSATPPTVFDAGI